MQRNLTPTKCAQRAHKKLCVCTVCVCVFGCAKKDVEQVHQTTAAGILVVFVDVLEVLASCCCCCCSCGIFFCYSKVVQALARQLK